MAWGITRPTKKKKVGNLLTDFDVSRDAERDSYGVLNSKLSQFGLQIPEEKVTSNIRSSVVAPTLLPDDDKIKKKKKKKTAAQRQQVGRSSTILSETLG